MAIKISAYIDDGLAIIKNKSARLADKTRKELHKIFEQFGLKITAEANLHVVNFLDVTFDPISGKHRPYRKPNDDPLSKATIPILISAFQHSSDKETFQDAAPIYQTTLGQYIENYIENSFINRQDGYKMNRFRSHLKHSISDKALLLKVITWQKAIYRN